MNIEKFNISYNLQMQVCSVIDQQVDILLNDIKFLKFWFLF